MTVIKGNKETLGYALGLSGAPREPRITVILNQDSDEILLIDSQGKYFKLSDEVVSNIAYVFDERVRRERGPLI